MAVNAANPDEQVVLGEEIDHVRLITLNRPRQLNAISPELVSLVAAYLEKWEKDDKAELVIIKGAGRTFSAGGDLKVFYDGKKTKDSCLEVVYRMYWLGYHIHTYKKTQVALVLGISMGGGASFMVPQKILRLPLQKQVLGFILIVAFLRAFSSTWEIGGILGIDRRTVERERISHSWTSNPFCPF